MIGVEPVQSTLHEYARPATLEQALAIQDETRSTILAGGTDIYPGTDRQCLPGPVLDIGGISDLRGISMSQPGIRIGATTTWSDILHADLPDALTALKLAAREVGSIQIQNAGTVVGNLCNASPAADGVPPLLIADTEVEVASVNGKRRLPLSEFVVGNRATALAPNEIATGLCIPESGLSGRSSFLKLGSRAHLVISIAMVAVRIGIDKDRISEIAVAVGACSPVAIRLRTLEAALAGRPMSEVSDIIARADVSTDLQPIADIRASREYRIDAAKTLILRCLMAAANGTDD